MGTFVLILASTLTIPQNLLSGITISWYDISGVLGWVVLSSGIIQFSPIKINPWTWVLGKLGAMLNQNVTNEINSLSKQVEKLEQADQDIKDEIERREAINSRRRILIFADDIRKGETRFSEERYNEILYDMKIYNNYCDQHKEFKNEKTVISQKIINEQYEYCLKNNLFL